MATFVVCMAIVIAVFFSVRFMIKQKKQGKSIGCGGDCAHCHKDCEK